MEKSVFQPAWLILVMTLFEQIQLEQILDYCREFYSKSPYVIHDLIHNPSTGGTADNTPLSADNTEVELLKERQEVEEPHRQPRGPFAKEGSLFCSPPPAFPPFRKATPCGAQEKASLPAVGPFGGLVIRSLRGQYAVAGGKLFFPVPGGNRGHNHQLFYPAGSTPYPWRGKTPRERR